MGAKKQIYEALILEMVSLSLSTNILTVSNLTVEPPDGEDYGPLF